MQDLGDGRGLHAVGLAGSGEIGGRPVRCCTSALQRRFHEGYREPLRTQDEHDLALLDELDG